MIEIVGEIGINHNGNLEVFKKLVDICSGAGLNYIKLQKRTIDVVYTKEELAKPRESPFGTTTREQKLGLEFNLPEYILIDSYCTQKNIGWFASPWDKESAFFLSQFKIPFLKIPSALITDFNFLEICRDTFIPLILSTGMSTLEMVDKAIDVIGKKNIYCIMHCTSTYPTKPEESNMMCIPIFRERYPWTKIGFSNHYPGLMSMVMAGTLGIDMIECHVTLDRSMYGSDQAASIEPQGIFSLMERIKLIEKMKGDGIKRIYDSELPIIAKLRK